jgi:hypothetical protein
VKEKKSILEKLGLVEKILDEGEQDLKAEELEVLVGPEVVNTVDVHNVDIKAGKDNASEPEDPMAGMRYKKLFKADEIYKSYNIKSQGINSLFIVESFLKALPDYLPVDVKRESMLNIVSSSGVKIENLAADGIEKLKCLKDFSQSFSSDASDTISRCESEIRKLSEKIDNYKRAIDDMKRLQEEQEAVVRYENERINNVLQFIDPQK